MWEGDIFEFLSFCVTVCWKRWKGRVCFLGTVLNKYWSIEMVTNVTKNGMVLGAPEKKWDSIWLHHIIYGINSYEMINQKKCVKMRWLIIWRYYLGISSGRLRNHLQYPIYPSLIFYELTSTTPIISFLQERHMFLQHWNKVLFCSTCGSNLLIL